MKEHNEIMFTAITDVHTVCSRKFGAIINSSAACKSTKYDTVSLSSLDS